MHPCLDCRRTPPPWTAAASYGPYEGPLRAFVLLFKEARVDELARPLSELLCEAFLRSSWPAPHAVVPVPTSWTRRLARGFDHTARLARPLATALAAPLVPALRRHGLGRQAGKARAARLTLPAAAFSVRRPLGGRVLLVDDVFTTGTTAARCSRALARAGAEEVYVLTLARTPRARRIP